MQRLVLTGCALSLALVGCGGDENTGGDYDEALLVTYRAAVPDLAQLSATRPIASTAAALGEPARYPGASYEVVTGINGAVAEIITVMRAVVDQEPTVYNSETKEFLWGPVANTGGFGTIAAYIKDAGETADFRYHYALLRGVNNDVATMQPVIWGGALPAADGTGHSVGVTLWDFEANFLFEATSNPDFDTLRLDRGRFAAVYGKKAEASGELAFAVAAFRDFVANDSVDGIPINLDYLYGRYAGADNTLDFVDWEAEIDVDTDPARDQAESIGVRIAFINDGAGRAEVDATGGDLNANQVSASTECWDTSLNQTYLMLEIATDNVPEISAEEGDAADCGLFEASLSELGIPALEDLNPGILAALNDVAENGVPSE